MNVTTTFEQIDARFGHYNLLVYYVCYYTNELPHTRFGFTTPTRSHKRDEHDIQMRIAPTETD